MLSVEYLLVGIIVVCILKVIVGLTAASAIAWAAYSFNILPWLPKFCPYIANSGDLLACNRNRNHGNDLSLLDENPGAGVGVCGSADAGVVHILSDLVAAALVAGHRVDDAAGACVRRGMRQVMRRQRDFRRCTFRWAAGLNLVYFASAIIFFGWIFEKARSRGLLVTQE